MASLNFLESSSGLKGHLGLIVPLGGSQVPDWTCWAIVTLLYVQETKLVLQLQKSDYCKQTTVVYPFYLP